MSWSGPHDSREALLDAVVEIRLAEYLAEAEVEPDAGLRALMLSSVDEVARFLRQKLRVEVAIIWGQHLHELGKTRGESPCH